MRGLLLLLMCAGCLAPPDSVDGVGHEVVYGEDDRTEVYAHPDEVLRDLSRDAIVALVRPTRLDTSDPRDVRPVGNTLGVRRDLCEGERFIDQPTAANCSGTLIDHDLVVTAGHCVDDIGDCLNYRFVFDYFYESEGELANIDLDTDVYNCREVIAREDDGSTDYAFVRLDRPVVGREPAAVRTDEGPIEIGQELTVIGFGSGIPAKIDDGGEVLRNRAGELDYFEANLDTFGGNSGSGVFVGQAWSGILVRGEGDYIERGSCSIVRTLPDIPEDGDDEDVTYGTRALRGLCATGYVTDLCEDTGGFCRVCAEDADCPEEWQCLAAGDDGSRFCAAPCGECPDGHVCVEAACVPEAESICRGNDVYEDRCGRLTGPVDRCRTGLVCNAGACEEAEPGDTCGTPLRIDPVDQTLVGRLGPGFSNRRRSRCGGAGPEVMIQFETDERVDFQADAFGFDTVLYLRRDCGEPRSEITCDDDGGEDRGSRLALELPAGQYTLILDAFSADVDDAYTLELQFGGEMPDAGLPDVGVDAGDDAGADDAGVDTGPADAGADLGMGDTGDPLTDEGCSCSVGSRHSPSVFGLLVVAGIGLRRLRRRR